MGFAETLVAAGAVVCVAPVALGFLVTRWVKFWSRSARSGPLV